MGGRTKKYKNAYERLKAWRAKKGLGLKKSWRSVLEYRNIEAIRKVCPRCGKEYENLNDNSSKLCEEPDQHPYHKDKSKCARNICLVCFALGNNRKIVNLVEDKSSFQLV